MNWDDLRYFLAVMRGGSLSAAARALQVQHSTVARRIDALESALGIRLFDRLPRGWPPTDEGLHLAEHAARVEADVHAFARAAQGAATLDGVVRVSASPVFASHFLAPRLARAQRAWPALRIDLIGDMHAANLYAREADLAVRLSRPNEPGLAARRLGTMRFALCASPDWAAAPPDTWAFVGYDDALAQMPQQQWLERFAAGRRFAFISNDLAALHRACVAGAGIALLPRFLVDLPGMDAGSVASGISGAPGTLITSTAPPASTTSSASAASSASPGSAAPTASGASDASDASDASAASSTSSASPTSTTSPPSIATTASITKTTSTDRPTTPALIELTSAPRCEIEREIWLVVHPDVRRSPRVQRVADAIAEAVRDADGHL
ncbi:LysR family transcriptional regulator [Burkholderia vietnamiensis]|uniref:LysR family transcriptional regulator n=1 Tax=Burkholderia vietnamiensis TaxID=60552 RepID=UPI00075AE5DF|nr:LysR family transcriptional regulator [Burkholderia vietnamiensis]KVE53278.1 LysR family transcriptional regulator [Burkholderia vietnamiensis]KVE87457.1 LysR family transcriptional regulator [Burkholderia vietnamiensis]MDN7924329.1 LysR family transcriptional regulator [Burkholderia vietnamiensis]HDR9248879.1 LysR family transcriptional regulator [Burkholderia vietnamiensis]